MTGGAVVAGLLASASASPAAAAADTAPLAVVVSGVEGADAAVAANVRAVGGQVTRRLDLVHGVAAQVPSGAVGRLRSMAGVRTVTPDARVHFSSVDPDLGYDPVKDLGSLGGITRLVGAQDAWKDGVTGKGVDVALIDSGVSPTPGLTSGNVAYGPDLSFDSQNSTVVNRDEFGHGTHMGSIIAGRDAAQTDPRAYADATRFNGVAPDARLVSLKLAGADGAVDVSQVIAAINWVDQHAHTNGLNIRVLNLSFGTDSTQAYQLDPLAFAAEQAWRHGLVVVVAGGNDGTNRTALSDPAMDPTVLAVGADDPMGTESVSDDVIPAFSQHGTMARHFDIVAPGVHVLGLRNVYSAIDQAYPSARVGTRFFRGSGTSQAAAVVSGAAALLLQRYPEMTPDQVKVQLRHFAMPLSKEAGVNRGTGVVNAYRAISGKPAGLAPAMAPASGIGTLEGARGSAHVSMAGVDLTGETDIFGQPWTAATWAPATALSSTWTGGDWNGSAWTGTDFGASSWASRTWTSRTWTGMDWTGAAWSSRTWTGSLWAGASWS